MGFDTSLFVDQPVDQGLLCNICFGVFDAPTTACIRGHTYCQDCVVKTKNSPILNISKNCPECREPMLPTQILNRPLMNLLMSQKIRCCNKPSRGPDALDAAARRRLTEEEDVSDSGRCAYTGTLAAYVESKHAGTCQLRMVKCPLGCNDIVVFSELERHKSTCSHRLVTCANCAMKIKEQLLDSHLAKACPEKSVQCRYCKVQLKRKNMGKIKGRDSISYPGQIIFETDLTGHYNCCPKIPLTCEFHPFGCTAMLPRQRMAAHHAEKAQHHASLVAKETKRIKDDMSKTKREMKMGIENSSKRVKKNFRWNVDRDELSGDGNKSIDSKSFVVGGYDLFFRLTAEGQSVKVGLFVKNLSYEDIRITVKFEACAVVGDDCEEVSFEFDFDGELEGSNNEEIAAGNLSWYDEEDGDDITVKKDHLLGCHCMSDQHVVIQATIDLSLGGEEIV
mmetsp:Transcript_20079/g.43290  ORF Transcript_20079/g.43290 Transcript_20079/m.43290 type:complete len:450 (-) Transcript_20079:268-1617(-)